MDDKYVISDENGNYVDYTRTYLRAFDIEAAGNAKLISQNLDGRYAIGRRMANGTYDFDPISGD